jgi:hypothetical protein
MPKFTYKPTGSGEENHRAWDFEPDKLMSPEAIAIEKLTGMTFGEWLQAVRRTSMTATHAYLYVMLKRETPALKPSDVTFSLSEVDIEASPEELRETLDDLLEIPEDERDEDDESMIERIQAELADTDEVPEAPKA